MFSCLAFCVGVSAGRAQSIRIAEQTAEAVADRGLTCWIDLQRAGRRCGSFERLADATLDLRLRATQEPATLLLDSVENRWLALPAVLHFELTHDDGGPLILPEFDLGTNFSPEQDWGSRAFLAQQQRVDKGGQAQRRIPLEDLGGIGGFDLEPGIYRMRALYRGIPELDERSARRTPWSEQCWQGSASSQELRFEITEFAEPLVWSPPQAGLRVAAVARPRGSRFFLDESVEVQFLVENVGEETLRFVRSMGWDQADEITTRIDGLVIGGDSGWSSGWVPTVTWTLQPGHRVWIDAQAYKPSVPGQYHVEYALSLFDGRVLPEDEAKRFARGARVWNGVLRAPAFKWTFLAREGE